MYIYEKPNNKLNIEIDNHNQMPTKETPDVEIYKEDDKTTIVVDGADIGQGGGGSSQALVLYANEYDDNSYFLYKDAAHEVPLTLEEAVAAEFGGARIIVIANISENNYECRDLIKAYVNYSDGDLKSITAITFKDKDAASYELYTTGG